MWEMITEMGTFPRFGSQFLADRHQHLIKSVPQFWDRPSSCRSGDVLYSTDNFLSVVAGALLSSVRRTLLVFAHGSRGRGDIIHCTPPPRHPPPGSPSQEL